ncbi:hypothetical protein V8B97DRAFT_2004733 [Scleroderma yunnanense]
MSPHKDPLESLPVDNGAGGACSHKRTSPNTNSTPIKPKGAIDQVFSTFIWYCNPAVNKIGQDMMGFMVSPMPVKDFLDNFLPTSRISDYSSMKHNFKKGVSFTKTVNTTKDLNMSEPLEKTISTTGKEAMYEPFMSVFNAPMYNY